MYGDIKIPLQLNLLLRQRLNKVKTTTECKTNSSFEAMTYLLLDIWKLSIFET